MHDTVFLLWYKNENQHFFLFQTIEEVGGHVLIALNKAPVIPLDNLRIIRGHSLYDNEYALAVLSNYNQTTGKGVNQLSLNSLTGMSRLHTSNKVTHIQVCGKD